MRKSGFLAMNEQGAVTYHCVSRVVDRDYKFGDKEKAVFVKMMRLHKLIATQSIEHKYLKLHHQ